MAILGQCTEMLAADDVMCRCPAAAIGRFSRSANSRGGVLTDRYKTHPMCAFHASSTAELDSKFPSISAQDVHDAQELGRNALRKEVSLLIEELKELRRKI